MMSIKKDGAVGGKTHLPLRRAEEWMGLVNSWRGKAVAGNQTARYFFLISVFRFSSAMVP